MTIKVCDAIMGSGKSTAAIKHMNESNNKFIYLTPYLEQVERILNDCKDRNFIQPINKGNGKLEDLHYALGKGRNIASTHALFAFYNDCTMDLIREGGYTLILDEVFNVLEPVQLSKSDIRIMFDSKLIKIDEDGEHVVWIDDTYSGKFDDAMRKAKTYNLIYYKDMLMFWTFPVDIFKSFKDVIILTYLFDAQVQKYYYDMNGVTFEKFGVKKIAEMEYEFCDKVYLPNDVYDLKSKIHICDHPKLNTIGGSEFALSSSWYKRNNKIKDKPLIQQMKNNLMNYFMNITHSSKNTRMWTTFVEYQNLLKGKGYSNGFIPFNMRATNKFIDYNVLAYCVNVYFNPVLKNYFLDHDVVVKEDEYALSEMLQWMWRSAIRRYGEIWLYAPSMRMRNLLIDWLDFVEDMKNN